MSETGRAPRVGEHWWARLPGSDEYVRRVQVTDLTDYTIEVTYTMDIAGREATQVHRFEKRDRETFRLLEPCREQDA